MSVTVVPLNPSSPGDFTVAHGVAGGPSVIPTIVMNSAGLIWFQNPVAYDATNLYLVSSGVGLSGFAVVSSQGSLSGTVGRYDGNIRDIIGESLVGVEIAVLTQPATTTTQPGSPLATLYSASSSNAPTVTTASWLAGVVTMALNVMDADVVAGSYVEVSGVTPTGYNGIVQVTGVSGLNITYNLFTNPGTYSAGGTLRTSALPNPFISDNLGNFFFYATIGLYTVQIYGGTLQDQLVLPDQAITLGGSGVSSVGLIMPAEFNVTGSPVNSSGNLTVTKSNENINLVYAGPASGSAAPPAFRALVSADLPAGSGTGTVTTLSAGNLTPLFTTSTANPTTAPAVSFSLSNAGQNLVLAGPASGGAGAPTYRNLVAADLNAALPAIPTIGGVFEAPTGAATRVVWRAPYACTVTNVRGFRVGGTGATVNANKNGSLTHLSSDLSLTSSGIFMDGGAVQNTIYAAGDYLSLLLVSEAGSPTAVTVQVDFVRN